MQVALSRMHFPVTALGPGRRLGIWLQGCSIRCPGCISHDTWASESGHVALGVVLDEMSGYAGRAEGLTVSGGEPFDQPEALAHLLAHWRTISGASVLVFTGHPFAEIADWLDAHPGLIDCVISGPYLSAVPQTLALRGSDNQEIHVLTLLGEEFRAFNRALAPQDRKLDVMFNADGGAWFAGIPARGEFARLRRSLTAAGNSVITSDMTGTFPQ